NRAFHLKVRVVGRVGARHAGDEVLADVHAAREADTAVHYEYLTVATQVGVGRAHTQWVGHEQGIRNVVAPERPGDRRTGIPHPDRVNEHPNFNAALVSACQRFDEQLALRVIVEDVGFQRDGFFGGIDGRNHRRVSLVAALQNADMVARAQGEAADPVTQVVQRRELRRGQLGNINGRQRGAAGVLPQAAVALFRYVIVPDPVNAGD